MVEKQTFKVSAINSLGSKVNKLQQSVHLDRSFCLIGVFCFFLMGLMDTVYRLLNSAKQKFLGKFGSHSIIHIFKNYFTRIFLVINF